MDWKLHMVDIINSVDLFIRARTFSANQFSRSGKKIICYIFYAWSYQLWMSKTDLGKILISCLLVAFNSLLIYVDYYDVKL